MARGAFAWLMAPWASQVPFQLMLAPRRTAARFEDDGPLGAALLHDGLSRLRRLFGASPPLNLWVRTAPQGAEQFCWRIDVLPRLVGTRRVYAYDFSSNRVPGVQEHEEHAYWRDVGTLTALAAAQQDTLGSPPRFNLWNRRWPIRGEFDAALLTRIQSYAAPAPWKAANRDRHTDERLSAS